MKKKLLSVMVMTFLVASCSSVEHATAKWKTPSDQNAGLSEGEKSSYLLNKPDTQVISPKETASKSTKKSTKKKAIKK